MLRISRRIPGLGLLVLILLASSSRPSPAQGRLVVPPVERTDAGDWNGTWYHENLGADVALWIRGEPNAPEIKLQYFGRDNVEHVVTDWSGHAFYQHRGEPGELSLEIESRDANTIRARWNWKFGTPERGRFESAHLTIYRAGDGRQLVMRFDDLHREYTGRNQPPLDLEQTWSFRKASRREVLWTELPF